LDLSDGLAIILAVLILAAAVFTSPHERQLIIGDKSEQGIKPESAEQLALHEKMVIR
jgi:hypothetical protein